jgi:hypothetical protein
MAHHIFSSVAKVFTKTTTGLYKPLNTNTQAIRLLHLHPGVWEVDIRAVLQESSIAEARDRYVTISCTWGHVDVVRQVSISCNGSSFFISENLFTALRRLRRIDGSILVWADAICINQADILERTRQVALMGEIYSNSQETMIWLGEPARNEDVGSHLSNTHDTSTTYLSKETSSLVWKGDSSGHRSRDLYLDAVEHSTAASLVPENSGLVNVQVGPDVFGAFCLIQDLSEGPAQPILRALEKDKVNALQHHGFRSTWHGLVLAKAHRRGSRSYRVWEGLERLMTRPWVHLPHSMTLHELTLSVGAHLGRPRDHPFSEGNDSVWYAFSAMVHVRQCRKKLRPGTPYPLLRFGWDPPRTMVPGSLQQPGISHRRYKESSLHV